MLNGFYYIIIRPLELLFELIYGGTYTFIKNYGLSIIVLSLVVNILLFPLYQRADAIQKEENEIQAKMAGWIAHIKKTFSGDERYMMLNAYYRENHYSAVYALRGSLSLFLQIPFFIAAYRFLSGYAAMKGVSFGPINDLSAPDALLQLGSVRINVLPVLMTLINIISGTIYSRGLPRKTKVQLYVMALFFLVFLYRSPSGLVFYWTLNNFFSLVKNVFYKLKNPKKVLMYIAASTGFLLFMAEVFLIQGHTSRQKMAVICLCVLLCIPLIMRGMMSIGIKKQFKATDADFKGDRQVFTISCAYMSLLVGMLIPLSVIAASPEEFINKMDVFNPLVYTVQPFLTACGFFMLWVGVFYWVAKKETRTRISSIMIIVLVIATVNYMFFGKNLGTISTEIKFETTPFYSINEQIFNLLICLLTAVCIYYIWKKKREVIRLVSFALLIGVVGLSLVNINKINQVYKEVQERLIQGGETPELSLNNNQKNVIVIMLDRAIDAYIPYIFKEKPELEKQFAGFTWYPNTISYGPFTNFGAPALFGGYEYTPEELNKRDDELLVDKHDEALKVMPKLFSDVGCTVTVCDPPYAGYSWIPDLTIFDDLQHTKAYQLSGRFTDEKIEKAKMRQKNRKRNLLCYSIFKTMPECFQRFLYNNGNWFNSRAHAAKKHHGKEENQRFLETFNNEFSVLKNLISITKIQKADNNNLLILQNSATHEQVELQKPDYETTENVNNEEFNKMHSDYYVINGRRMRLEDENQEAHYDVNMAALIQLGNWFDYLREQGAYDNSKIIIVADHGRPLNQFDDMIMDHIGLDTMFVNPLLMVKEYNENKPEVAVDDRFMTNADVPSIAAAGLLKDPVNPYTGKAINQDAKKGEQHIVISHNFEVSENNGNVFDTSDGFWCAVKDNIFEPDNWRRINE